MSVDWLLLELFVVVYLFGVCVGMRAERSRHER